MSLTERINREQERRQTDIRPVVERREASPSPYMAGRPPYMAAWRRRGIEKAGGPFVAVAWREVPAA